jgi:hypothetical protein
MEKYTIGGLRNILVSNAELEDIHQYFMDLATSNFAAISGKISKDKAIKHIVNATAHEICRINNLHDDPDNMVLVGLRIIEVKQRFMSHGTAFVNGKHVITFFYFSDLDKGMAVISEGAGRMAHYARITIKLTIEQDPLEYFSDN